MTSVVRRRNHVSRNLTTATKRALTEKELALPRCKWVSKNDELNICYHDQEWGVPLHDDQQLFEMLILEGAQAGLSWTTILKKRENYRRAFANFDPTAVARFSAAKQTKLMEDPGIVRNRLKISATVDNAKAFLEIQKEFGSFDAYIWSFVDGKPLVNRWTDMKSVPAKTEESEKMSKDLKKRGFRFVGPTICYAFMQATGLVNDHTVDCFRYKALAGMN